MKHIREMDLAAEFRKVVCRDCQKRPDRDVKGFWTQVGFTYRCSPCSEEHASSVEG